MATESPPGELGTAAPAFLLPATDGRTYELADVRGPKGLVVIFMCNHCPYVQAALPRIVRDARDLATLGIGTVGINSNDSMTYPEDSFERMVALSADWQLPCGKPTAYSCGTSTQTDSVAGSSGFSRQ